LHFLGQTDTGVPALDGRDHWRKNPIELDGIHRPDQGFLSKFEETVQFFLGCVAIDAAVSLFQGLPREPEIGDQFVRLDRFFHDSGR
jgi:hypothetical protein